MDIYLSYLYIGGGFIILIKGADLLVDGACALAAKLAISEIVIGLVIVSFGTSAPELIVNVFAAIEGKVDFSFGNIIGSNIMNILLILGVAGLIRPLKTQKNTVWREIPFALMAALILLLLCNDQWLGSGINILTRSDGIIMLFFFIIFLSYSFTIAPVESTDKPDIKLLSNTKIGLNLTIGIIGLFLGGKLIINGAVDIAREYHMSDKLIGLTILAIGTSLPELVTSAIAAKKGKIDIAIGNVIGSNIFNIFFILAITATINPLEFDTVLNFDFTVLILASVMLFFTMFTGKRRVLDRWEAILFLSFYIIYTVYLIVRN
jgi:cation:H+ antiporter